MSGQLAWYVGGPAVGLCVVAMRWLFNERLGATAAWSSVVDRLSGERRELGTAGWLLVGLFAGGLIYGVVHGGAYFDDYGWLTATFDGEGAEILIAAILLGAGFLIGFGARMAGGCTSGNGLSGTAALSPASLVATASFFATGIAVSFLIEGLIS